MMRTRWLVTIITINVLSFFLCPFVYGFRLVSLLLTMVASFCIIFLTDSWYKYFYPVFIMSCFIIVMRFYWLIDFLDFKALIFVFSWIGSSCGCIVSALKLAFTE
jgi:hypothetical protein